MVESRDVIIDELNNRISVFEEDKVVLKAALRQLQKEMKEEEPKTAKLIDDLAEAEQEVERIKAEVHSIIETHQDEIATLQMTMSQKQKKITDAESNLTAIGTYVDKLEERLTSFAITRRDMEEREKKCKDIEKNAEESEIQRMSMQTKVEDFQKQEEELKKLLEELVVERTDLQKENRRLYTEQEFRIGEQEQMESTCKALQKEAVSMREQIQEWKKKCESLVPELEASRKSELDLEHQVEVLKGTQEKLSALQVENKGILETKQMLEEEMALAVKERDRLEAMLASNKIKEDKEKAEATNGTQEINQLPPPPPPRRLPHLSSSNLPNRSDVTLRSLRKTLSKATGLHGVLTPSSKMIRDNRTPTSSGEPRKSGAKTANINQYSSEGDKNRT